MTKTSQGLKLRSAFPCLFSNYVQRENSFQGRSRTDQTVVEGTVNRIYLIAYVILRHISAEPTVRSSQTTIHR